MAKSGTQITIYSEDSGTTIKGTAKQRDSGTDTVIDLNDVSTITITLRAPDGVVTTQTATAVSTDGGTDGIWSFTTGSAIFSDKPGIWEIQAKYEFSSGKILYSQIKRINVGEVLE